MKIGDMIMHKAKDGLYKNRTGYVKNIKKDQLQVVWHSGDIEWVKKGDIERA
jgi:hypothetical protein